MALTGYAFSRVQRDPLRVPDPEHGGGSTLCGITSDPTGRGFLLEEDKGAGGGGAGVTFDEKQQAKVNEIVQAEKAKLTAKLDDQKKLFDAQAAEFATLKESLGALQKAADTAREEGELKGKTDLEKLQHQFDKAQKQIKDGETTYTAKLAELTKSLETERGGRVDDAKRNWATSVLAAGAREGMSTYAIQALLNEGQFEIDDNRQVTKVTFEGGAYDKPAEVAAAFYKARPGFAKPVDGGTDHPRHARGGNGSGMDSHSSIAGAIGAGLAERSGA